MEINDAINLFLQFCSVEKGLTQISILDYKEDLRLFANFIDVNDVNDLKGTDIIDFQIYQAKNNLKSTSIRRRIVTLNSFYNFLKCEGYVDSSIKQKISIPKVDKKLPEFLTDNEVQELLCAPDVNTDVGIRDKAMLSVLYYCGIRISELVNLKMSDLKFSEKTISVLGKGLKERLIPISDEAIEIVLNYIKNVRNVNKVIDKDYVFS